MSQQQTFNTKILKVRSAVLVFHQDRLLLMKQNGRPFWVLPGGTLEEGESIGECAVRELQEEAGMTVDLLGMLALSEFADEKRHVIDVTFLGRYLEGNLQWKAPYPENIDRIAWLTYEEVQETTLKPDPLHKLLNTHWNDLCQGRCPILENVYLGLCQ